MAFTLAACGASDSTTAPERVSQVAVLGLPDTLASGDIMPFVVTVRDDAGRVVLGRTPSIASSNVDIATIDPSGRVRAVSAGIVMISATVDGIVGARPVVVIAQPVALPLHSLDGHVVPFLEAADSVMWDGVHEYHELYVDGGRLQLSGGSTPRYVVELHRAEYAVSTDGAGQRRMVLRAAWTERDRGLVEYDARGGLVMTSEIAYPLVNTATPESAGFAMRYRIPGDDIVLSLFFRREPK
jgi:hypothetical protein